MRDPITALPSIILENQHSMNNASYLFRRKHLIKHFNIALPESVTNINPIELATKMYLGWNQLISMQHPDVIFRIEHDHEKLVQFLLARSLIKDIPKDFSALCNTKINADKKYVGIKYEKPSISRENIIKNLQAETLAQLYQLCQQYGYTL